MGDILKALWEERGRQTYSDGLVYITTCCSREHGSEQSAIGEVKRGGLEDSFCRAFYVHFLILKKSFQEKETSDSIKEGQSRGKRNVIPKQQAFAVSSVAGLLQGEAQAVCQQDLKMLTALMMMIHERSRHDCSESFSGIIHISVW